MRKNKNAFTLVEIMIVVAIIALIAAIAVPNFLRTRTEANDAAAKAALKTISTALENYSSINGVYPSDTSLLIGDTPPYLTKDFFTGSHSGFTFQASTLTDYAYLITAIPNNTNAGTGSFTISTGAILNNNP